MIILKHYLTTFEQKETKKEIITNDRECKRQKQLANKEKRMFGKVNKEKNKQ
jgi:hypothetical protein